MHSVEAAVARRKPWKRGILRGNYGFEWWLASREEGYFFGPGEEDQFICVNPNADLAIVTVGWSMGGLRRSEWIGLFQAISEEASRSKADRVALIRRASTL